MSRASPRRDHRNAGHPSYPQYEARLAERRYMAVDPDNRAVARTLERGWEDRLRELEEVHHQYEDARRARHVDLSERDRARIRQIAADLPRVWQAPSTSSADKKAMLRLAIEAVVLHPVEVPKRHIRACVQWKGGARAEREVPWPSRREWGRTPEEAMDLIRDFAEDGVHDEEIAQRLNEAGIETGKGKQWNVWAVRWARNRNGIRQTAKDRPRSRPVADRHLDGRYSIPGASMAFGVSEATVRRWATNGLVEASKENDGHNRLVWWLRLDEATAARLVEEHGPHAPQKAPLPDRRRDGRYSVPGLARRFGVGEAAVRGLIRRGRLAAVQEDHGSYREAWWVQLDDAGERALCESAERSRRRRKNTSTPPEDTSS